MKGISFADAMRFIDLFPYSMPVFIDNYGVLLKNKSSEGLFTALLNNFQDEILKKLGAPKALIGKIEARLCLLKDEEGKLRLCIDPNMFFNDVLLQFNMKTSFNEFRELMSIHSDFYTRDSEESNKDYRRSIKRKLIDIKSIYQDFVADHPYNFRDQESMKARQKAQIAAECLGFVQFNVQNIIDAFSVDLSTVESIADYIDPEKLVTYSAYVASSSLLVPEGEDEDELEHLRFGDLAKNYILFDQIRKETDPDFKIRFKAHIVGDDIDITSTDLARHIANRSKERNIDLSEYGVLDTKELLEKVLIDYNEELLRREKQRRIEEFKNEILVTWEIIPESIPGTGEARTKGLSIPKTESEKIADIEKAEKMLEDKLEVFENSDYLVKLRGVDTFSGYVSFVYPDGRVFSDVFYKNTRKGLVPATGEAMYVMTIDKFKEFSKLTKAEIRELRRSDSNVNIQIMNHSANFKNRLSALLDNMSYDDLTISYINGLIEELKDERKLEQ